MPSLRTRMAHTIAGDGTIRSDKVLTGSMVARAAGVTSVLYYNAAGATIGTAGSYVDLPGGPLVVSVETGGRAGQQAMVKALVGMRRGGGANDFVTLRCRRNDGTILAFGGVDQTYTYEITNDQTCYPVQFVDTAPSANVTHTYTVQANSDDTGTQFREQFAEAYLSKTG